MSTNENNKIVTRIAPSPTGLLHFGTGRSSLYNFLIARKNNGKFILRIEDTDKQRSTPEFEKNIIEGLEWLGLKYDEFYRQSERSEIYKKHLEKMIENNTAYVSKNEEGERGEVIRFKNPNTEIVFNDLIRGEITFDTTELGDFVIAKSLGEPLYHLAVVIDDFEMGVTHVIRGEDGISNTPRQILIQEAIGAPRPAYAHLPLILGKDRSKMSKRHGPTSLTSFRDKGYLKEAVINYMAFLGWNHGDEREIFSLDELINEFDLSKVSKSGAIFDEDRLNWYNREYMKNISDEFYLANVKKYFSKTAATDEDLIKIKKIITERINVFSDLEKLNEEGEFAYFFEDPDIKDISKLMWKETTTEKTVKHLEEIVKLLAESKNASIKTPDEAKELIWPYADKNGRGEVLWPLRYALSGKEKSPDPFTLISVLGKDKTIERISFAINKINEAHN